MSLYDEWKEDRKKNQNLSLYDQWRQDNNITTENSFKTYTAKDMLNDFNEKRKVFNEVSKAQAERTLTDLVGKAKNVLDTAGSIGQNIIDDARNSGAEDLSSYVQKKQQEQAITKLKTTPGTMFFDPQEVYNQKIKEENRQNSKYKSLKSEDEKIKQALDLQNNLRTEATSGEKLGYTVGDTLNNVVHGMTDTGTNLVKSLFYWSGDIANAFGDKDKADLLYKIAGTKDAASQYVYEPLQEELEKYSALDETGRAVAQGIGQQMARVGLSAGGNIIAGGIGLTEQGTKLFNDIASNTGMFAGSMASARDEAISQGATQDQARIYGYLSGLSETASEAMFGGFGKLTDAMGISRGVGGLDEKLAYALKKNISNAFARNLINLGVSAVGEGTEEIVSGLASAVWKKLTYLPEEDLSKLIENENLAQSFVVGALTSAIFQSPEYISSTSKNIDMNTKQDIQTEVQQEQVKKQYKEYWDNFKKENPEAYKMLKDSEEYFKKNGESQGELIESAKKYGYEPYSAEIQATQNILNRSGITGEFDSDIFGGDTDIEGIWTTDENGERKIIFNPDAKGKTIFQKVAVHELTHDVLNRNTKESQQFKNDILDLISKDDKYKEARTKIEEIYKKLEQNGQKIYDLTTEEGKANFNSVVEEELITNAMAEKFGSQEEINRLVNYKPSLARRIYDKIVEWGKKLTGSEKAYWKDIQNKFEKAYNTQGNIKENELRASVDVTDNNVNNTTDSQGKTLTKQQQEYFKNSKVRDKDGNLLEVYHGTPVKERFNTFDRNKAGSNVQADFDGIYFTDSNKFAERFSHQQLPTNSMFKTKLSEENGNIYKGYLNIQNPLNLNNLSEEQINELYNYIDTSKGMESKKDFIELLNKINNGVNPQLIKFYLDLSKVEEAGYDGIIANLGNKEEVNGKYQNTNENEYIVFNSNQFKNIDNENPTENPDIRYSLENDSLFGYKAKGKQTTLEELRTSQYKEYNHPDRVKERATKQWNNPEIQDRYDNLLDIIDDSNLTEEQKVNLKWDEVTKNPKLDMYESEVTLKDFDNIEKSIKEKIQQLEQENAEEELRQKQREEESKQRIKEKQEEKKSWAIAKQQSDTYDSKTYDLLENLEEKYPTNKNGKRTGQEWYDFANELGQELKKMGKTEQAMDKIAKQTWYLYDPGHNLASSNKAAGYENKPLRVFNNSWVKAIKNGYDSIETILPKQAKIENKTIPIKENKTISQNEEIESRDNKVLVNPEDIQMEEQGQKGRRTLESIIQSEQTDEQTKEIAKNNFNISKYTPVSNVETLGDVNRKIRELGEDKLYNAFMTKMETGEKTTLQDIATGERLIQVYAQKGDYEKVNNLVTNVAILGTELGQQVQALSLIKRATPEGQLLVLERLVQRANLKDKTNIKITTDMSEKIKNSKTQTELANNVKEVTKELAQQLPLNFIDKTRSWRYLSMLGNPKTHIRNTVANFGMGAVQDVKNTLAGMVEDVYYTISKKEGERTKTLKFANKDQRNFAKQDAEEMLNLIDGGGKYEQQTTLESNKRAFDNKFLNWLAEMNSKALDVEDKWFLRAAYKKAMAGYMAANNLTSSDMTGETLQKARNYASLQAQEATFHQFSQLAKTLGAAQKKNKVTNFLVSAVVPFKKTPINIAKTGFEYSPAGLMKTTYQAIQDITKTRNDLRTQLANGDITQEQYNTAITEKINKGIDNLSKNLTGTALTVIGYALAKMGVIKAGNDDKEDEYEANEGKQTYSMQIGDYNFSLDWLAPSTVPLFMGAEIEKWVEDAQTEEGDTWKNVSNFLDSASKMFEPMTDMSMIQGITNALKSFESGSPELIATNFFAKPISSYVSQYVPTALGQIAKSVDPYQRDTTSTQSHIPGIFDKTGKQILSKIPGASQLLPAKVDVWGNKVESQNYLQNAFSPSTVKEYKETATDKELKRLYESTGTNVFPTTFSLTKYYKKDGKEYRLTPEEYNEMKTNYGQTSKEYIDNLIKSSDYKNMSDTQKAKAITEIYTYAKNSNKIKYMQGQGLTEDEKTNVKTIKSMINEGANPIDYFAYKGLTDGMKKESEKNKALLLSNMNNKSKQVIYENNTGADDTFFKSFKETNPNMDSYLDYKTQEFTSDKDSNGKTIQNSKKAKVYNYIAQSNFDYPQRLMLVARDYTLQTSEKQYLVNYITSLDLTTNEMIDMLSACGNNFTVRNGQVYFK